MSSFSRGIIRVLNRAARILGLCFWFFRVYVEVRRAIRGCRASRKTPASSLEMTHGGEAAGGSDIVTGKQHSRSLPAVWDTNSAANDHVNALLKAGAIAGIHFHFGPKPWALKMECRSLPSEIGNKAKWCGQKWIAGKTALPTLVAAWENAFRRGLTYANLTAMLTA
jgi:hypothetical protein